MANLKDYSGPFKRDIKPTDFSKEALVRLYQAACKDYLGIDGIWLALMRKTFGDEKAWKFDNEVWEDGTKGEVRRTREALNITGLSLIHI